MRADRKRMPRLLLAILAGVLLAACAPVPPDYTESAEIDAAWSRVLDCYAKRGYSGNTRQPDVIVRPDCVPHRSGVLVFPGVTFGDDLVAGTGDPRMDYVIVCSDMAALEHEFSHCASHQLRHTDGLHKDNTTGAAEVGCYGVI
jgi:hypothetical protein